MYEKVTGSIEECDGYEPDKKATTVVVTKEYSCFVLYLLKYKHVFKLFFSFLIILFNPL